MVTLLQFVREDFYINRHILLVHRRLHQLRQQEARSEMSNRVGATNLNGQQSKV